MAEHELIMLATKKHATRVGNMLSPSTRDEIFASGNWIDGPRYLRALLNRSIEASTVFAPNRAPLAMLGIMRAPEQWVSLWVATTVIAVKYPIWCSKAACAAINTVREKYPDILMHIHSVDAKGLRLATSLGLEIGPAQRRGPHGSLFHPVVIRTRKLEVA